MSENCFGNRFILHHEDRATNEPCCIMEAHRQPDGRCSHPNGRRQVDPTDVKGSLVYGASLAWIRCRLAMSKSPPFTYI